MTIIFQSEMIKAFTWLLSKKPFLKKIFWSCMVFLAIGLCSCTRKNEKTSFEIFDQNLRWELVTENPVIKTPIGLAIDSKDDIYVVESHTHSPSSDYKGPKYDHILKCIDRDQMSKPESWVIFADSIEQGMNLKISENGEVFLTSKEFVLKFEDIDRDSRSDIRDTLVQLVEPEYVYDHAGILGIDFGNDNWVYVSRGNVAAKPWRLVGADNSQIRGYGDGGTVFRFKKDGSQLEKLASGFWNPFDLKFLNSGRLLVTDNDPDSRGPNRLIEIVPGGDYGHASLYGGSGVHPFQAWNGELPGTLPFAAPLGEAPCAFMDAGNINFGMGYENAVLVNIWEESNIVRIPLNSKASTVVGVPEILVQGDSTFHPVAMAADSKGNVYVSDWVVRKYPNHGKGKIWKLSAINKNMGKNLPVDKVDRFDSGDSNWDQLIEILKNGDEFERSIARFHLTKPVFSNRLIKLVENGGTELRLQALITLQYCGQALDQKALEDLLIDDNIDIQKAAMLYISKKLRVDLKPGLHDMLASGKLAPDLVELYLATVQHLQPGFMESFNNKSSQVYNELKLPEGFIESIIFDKNIPEETKAVALPYIENPEKNEQALLGFLNNAVHVGFRTGLLKAVKNLRGQEVEGSILKIALDKGLAPELRAQAILFLGNQQMVHGDKIKNLLTEKDTLVQYSAIKYLCKCNANNKLKSVIETLVEGMPTGIVRSVWENCNGTFTNQPTKPEEWAREVNGKGDPKRGQLVFESPNSLCQSCHQVNGWGGAYGPNLSKVGSSKSRGQLTNAILYPSMEIAPEWQGWFVVDEMGVKHQGRQIDVHLNRVELMNVMGGFDNYQHPRSYGVSKNSLMPSNLQNTMIAEEFNDLIAYLESLNETN